MFVRFLGCIVFLLFLLNSSKTKEGLCLIAFSTTTPCPAQSHFALGYGVLEVFDGLVCVAELAVDGAKELNRFLQVDMVGAEPVGPDPES